MSVLKKACGSVLAGSRNRIQRTGKTGVPGLYHKAMSDVISSVLPPAGPYQAETRMLFRVAKASFDTRPLFHQSYADIVTVRLGPPA